MRLFFGVPVDDAVRQQVAELQRRLRPAGGKVKWVEPANLHFTLRFLGEVPDERAGDIATAAKDAWQGIAPQRLVLRGVGCFPDPRRPRVVWIGAAEGTEVLTRLSEALEQRLETALGLQRETKQFVPHLTIGRVKAPPRGAALAQLIEELGDVEAGTFTVDHFVLYESQLTPGGPVYHGLVRYHAGAAGG